MESYDILVAKLGRTIGLNGEMSLKIYSDFSSIFSQNNIFEARIGSDKIKLKIESFNPKKPSIKFHEINSQESAAELKNVNLYSTISDSRKCCELKKDEFFYFDIVGLKIIDDGLHLGVVSDILEISGLYYLEIKTNKALLENNPKIKAKSFLLPYIERYIIAVELENKRILTLDAKFILEQS